jgi:hypothetical protein
MEVFSWYARGSAAAVVAMIVVWMFVRTRTFTFRRMQGLVRWSVGITIAAVLANDLANSNSPWNAHLLFHSVVFLAALSVIVSRYVAERKDLARRLRFAAGRSLAETARAIYATGIIVVSVIWVALLHLSPRLSESLAGGLPGFGWVPMGLVWGVAMHAYFNAVGTRRPISLSLGYGLLLFLSSGLMGATGEFGRLVAPGFFLLLQAPVLLPQPEVSTAELH